MRKLEAFKEDFWENLLFAVIGLSMVFLIGMFFVQKLL
jgi:hypothetical protein